MDAGTSGARRLILGPSLKHMRMRDRVFAEYLTPWWGIALDDLYADESVAENEQCGFGYRRYQDEETENHIQHAYSRPYASHGANTRQSSTASTTTTPPPKRPTSSKHQAAEH